MSTPLYEDGELSITSFAGGKGRGPCAQIDVNNEEGGNADYGMVQVTRTQAETVVRVLAKWLGMEVSR